MINIAAGTTQNNVAGKVPAHHMMEANSVARPQGFYPHLTKLYFFSSFVGFL
jgi:hypothetical protein